MPRQVITYDNFRGGEFGAFSDFNPPAGSFTGTNVVRQIDGSLGPRWEPEVVTLTALPTGTIRGIGKGLDGSGNPIVWFIVADRVYSFKALQTATQAVRLYTTALAVTPSYVVDGGASLGADGSDTYISVFGDKVYRLDHAAGAVTAAGGPSPGAYVTCLYGDRMLAANAGGLNNRVYFSLAADFGGASAWDLGASGQWFDVGDSAAIRSMVPQRGGVTISKVGHASTGTTPNQGQWWRLTGVPGVNDQLQKVADHNVPGEPSQVCLLGNGNLGFLSAFSLFPAVFTGAGVTSLRHIPLPGASAFALNVLPTNARAMALRDDSDWMVLADSAIDSTRTAFLLREGCWTKHSLSTVATSAYVVSVPLSDVIVLAKDGPTFYRWQAYTNRPNFSSDTYCTAPPAVDVTVTLPEFWSKNGEELAVRSVSVDFKKYDHGYSVDNSFTVTVTPRRLTQAGDGLAQTGEWTEDRSEASTSGTRHRERFSFTFGYGNGYQLVFTDIYGVSLQKVFVELETQPARAL